MAQPSKLYWRSHSNKMRVHQPPSIMLSPTPLSLLCALLLCLPLAIVFTVTTPSSVAITTTPTPHSSTTTTTTTTTPTAGAITTTPSARAITTLPTPHSSNSTPSAGAITPHSTTTPSARAITTLPIPHSSNTTPSAGDITTLSTPPTPRSTTRPSSGSATSHLQTSTATMPTTTSIANKSAEVRPLSALPPAVKTLGKPHNKSTNISSSSSAQAIYGGAAQNETDDDVEDNLLFQLAGRVDPNPKQPIKKLAFMFLTTTALPFADLWELFFNNTPKNLYNMYIHADPSFNYTPPFRGVFADRVIPSKPTRRLSSTLVSAARRLLSRALLHDESNYMFALLSSSCIPLHSFNFTYRFLMESKKSFIEILKDEPGAYVRWAARGEDVMAPEVKFEDFRIGSQFFVMKRKHARVAVRDSRLWPKFKLPCVSVSLCYPEEHYFPTLLSMVDPRGCVPATLTHVDWRGSLDGHPRSYHKDDVGPELIRALRKAKPRYGSEGSNDSDSSVTRRRDPFLFARKFSPDAVEPLLDIANDVIFKD